MLDGSEKAKFENLRNHGRHLSEITVTHKRNTTEEKRSYSNILIMIQP